MALLGRRGAASLHTEAGWILGPLAAAYNGPEAPHLPTKEGVTAGSRLSGSCPIASARPRAISLMGQRPCQRQPPRPGQRGPGPGLGLLVRAHRMQGRPGRGSQLSPRGLCNEEVSASGWGRRALETLTGLAAWAAEGVDFAGHVQRLPSAQARGRSQGRCPSALERSPPQVTWALRVLPTQTALPPPPELKRLSPAQDPLALDPCRPPSPLRQPSAPHPQPHFWPWWSPQLLSPCPHTTVPTVPCPRCPQDSEHGCSQSPARACPHWGF